MWNKANVYLALVATLALLGLFFVRFPIQMVFVLLAPAYPSINGGGIADWLPDMTLGLIAIGLPAWLWAKRGLLPADVPPTHRPRLLRGLRLLAVGNFLFYVVAAVPMVVAVAASQLQYIAILALLWWAIAPACLVLWVTGLYFVRTSSGPTVALANSRAEGE